MKLKPNDIKLLIDKEYELLLKFGSDIPESDSERILLILRKCLKAIKRKQAE